MTKPMSEERLRFLADYYNVHRMPTTTAAELCAEIRRCWERIAELTEALDDMAAQFGYWVKGEPPGLSTGGLSALEVAFGVLGWDDPHPAPALECDQAGCGERATCGFTSSGGYRRTCERHYRMFADD